MRTVTDDRKFRFTDTRLEAWPPKEGEVVLFDTDKPGLVLRVRGDSKSFYLWRTDARTGKTAKRRIGSLGEWTVGQARAEVDRIAGMTVENGGAVPKRDRPSTHTLGDAFFRYIAYREGEGGRSVYQQRRMYALYLERFAHVRMDAIDDVWVETNVKHAVARGEGLDERRKNLRRSGGTYTANNVLVMFRAMFGHFLRTTKDARGRALSLTRMNPCVGVKLYPTARRETCMDPDEIKRFIAAIDTFKREHCVFKHTRPGRGMFKGQPIEARLALADVLFVCIVTGQRRGAVAGMRWADVHLGNDPTWRIPAIKGNKAKKPKTIHLPPRVADMLRARRERCGDGKYVFPGARGADRVKDPRKVYHKILRLAGIDTPGLTIHDLRAAFVTLGVVKGLTTDAIAKAVGHDSPGTTTEHYVRLSENQKRDVARTISDAMFDEEAA